MQFIDSSIYDSYASPWCTLDKYLMQFIDTRICNSSWLMCNSLIHRDITHMQFINPSRYDSYVIHRYTLDRFHGCSHAFLHPDAYMCDVTHSYMWHDSFICVTWLIHMCDIPRRYVWHDSFNRVTKTHAHTHTHTHTHTPTHTHWHQGIDKLEDTDVNMFYRTCFWCAYPRMNRSCRSYEKVIKYISMSHIASERRRRRIIEVYSRVYLSSFFFPTTFFQFFFPHLNLLLECIATYDWVMAHV